MHTESRSSVVTDGVCQLLARSNLPAMPFLSSSLAAISAPPAIGFFSRRPSRRRQHECMRTGIRRDTMRRASLLAALAAGICALGLRAEAPPADAAPASQRLTLDEIKQRILSNNKLLELAGLNVQSKGYATRAMAANYFPQIIGQSVFLHFNDDLG